MKHRAAAGECFASIAFAHGFTPEFLWDHPDNAPLRELRPGPFHLVPGDEVSIPDLRITARQCETTKLHTFRRRNTPEKFRVKLQADGEARKDTDYVFNVDGEERNGKTDGDGWLEEWIPPNAKLARVLIDSPQEHLEFRFRLGHLQPVTTTEGQKGRLQGMGLLMPGADAGMLRGALRRFQEQRGLRPTGEPDEATQAHLVIVYGS